MKKIIVCVMILLLVGIDNPSISASKSSTSTELTSCSSGQKIINTTPDVNPGNGGQSYISNVDFDFHNAWSADPSTYTFTDTIKIYDWNGKNVEDIEITDSYGTATGLVDGTYTFTFINDLGETNKGQFDVNHNINNTVHVEMTEYLCGFDSKIDYIQGNRNDDSGYVEISDENPGLLQQIAYSLSSIAQSLSELVQGLIN